uniref:Annexin A9 n=1 Tax=Laticauda laticaudata TaxID=8630 RepID=A0A8C5RDF8_LATLA
AYFSIQRDLQQTATWGTLGTIRPHLNFDAAKDAQTFFEAISGEDFDTSGSPANSRGRSRVCKLLFWRPRLKLGAPRGPKGVDCRVLLDLLTSRSSEHRQQIAEAFLEFTQQGLLKTLEAVFPGQLQIIIRGLLRPAAQYDALEIQAGLQGLEVETLIEIISTRTAKQLQDILACYKQDFKSDLEKDIACGTTDAFRDLLLALIKGQRECYSGVIDYVLIRQDSKVRGGLRGASLWGTPPRWDGEGQQLGSLSSVPQTPGRPPHRPWLMQPPVGTLDTWRRASGSGSWLNAAPNI